MIHENKGSDAQSRVCETVSSSKKNNQPGNRFRQTITAGIVFFLVLIHFASYSFAQSCIGEVICPALTFDGTPADRVRQANNSQVPDGNLDPTFTVTFPAGPSRTVTSLSLASTLGGVWNTNGSDGFWTLGAASTVGGALFNSAADDSVSFPVAGGGSFEIFASNWFQGAPFPSGLFLPGQVFTLTIGFSDASTATASTTLGSEDSLPAVTVAANLPNAAEGGAAGQFTVTRSIVTASPLLVTYAMGGTAGNGADYALLPLSVTILANQPSATININPIGDTLAEPTESAILTLSANAAYTIGSPSSDTVTIADNAAPGAITLAFDGTLADRVRQVNNSQVPDGNLDPTFTVTFPAGPSRTVTSLSLASTLGGVWNTNGSDGFWTLGAASTVGGALFNSVADDSVSFPVAGGGSFRLFASNWFQGAPFASGLFLPGQVFTLTIGFSDASTATGSTTLGSLDSLPTVTVAANLPNAAEGGAAGQFTVTRSIVTASPLLVTYAMSGTADNGADYALLPLSVTILANQPSATININPIGDTLAEPTESAILTLSANAAYTIGSPSSDTVTIADNVAPGAITLAFDGTLADRVRQVNNSQVPDGMLDPTFTVTFPAGPSRTVTSLSLASTLGGVWNTHGSDGFWTLGAASTVGGALFNSVADDSVSFPVAGGGSFRLFASNWFQGPPFPSGLFLPGQVFTLTVTFSDSSTATASTTLITAPLLPDLTISKTHSGNFLQGSTGNNYTITVTNSGTGNKNAGQAVSVTDAPPPGMTVTAMSGTGWTCAALPTCTRSDLLAAGNAYPTLSATVSVTANASSPQINSISVATAQPESNSSNNTATDSTTITPVNTAPPPEWGGYANNPQHTAISSVPSQPLSRIIWQTPVDLLPQYSGSSLLVHYGSPVVTAANTVILPVKTGASDGFQLEARRGSDGLLLYTLPTDYSLPPHNWTPSFGPVLSAGNRLYYAGAGGTVYYRDQPDSPTGPSGQFAFYGNTNYAANAAAFNAAVKISTPMTSDRFGNIFFGYTVVGANPLNLQSGIARITSNGIGSFVTARDASGGVASITQVPLNSTPALSNDHSVLYFAVSTGNFGGGYLVSVDSSTLAPIAQIRLQDPRTLADGLLADNGTAAPTVGPDGDVYYGILENPFLSHNARGWMLHFDGALSQTKIPGAFGWDTTASVVTSTLVPSYQGAATYLLLTKYNNYARLGSGDGVNKIAVLDPTVAMTDPLSGVSVMREVLTIAGPTPDNPSPSFPNAVREWCINTAVVDPFTKSALVNNEDGILYRWDFTTNTLSEHVVLTTGIGEAYTPTLVGVDGTVYAINNAILFAVGH